MPNLPQQRDRLQPSEALFNAFPFPLTDGISGVLRGTSINAGGQNRGRGFFGGQNQSDATDPERHNRLRGAKNMLKHGGQ
jgi:hypothetical protein